MDVPRAVTEAYKIWLAGGAVLLVLAWPWLASRWRRSLLWVLVLLSLFNYARWGWDSVSRKVDAYDLIHYYLNAKYFDGLGYYDLYPCVILADHENGGPHFDEGGQYLAQHVGGHVLNPIDHALARGRHVRQTRFSAEDWDRFEHDALYLQRTLWRGDSALYRQMIQDHGYNGTVAWTVLAAPLAEWVPVEAVKWLCHADAVLLLAAVLAVCWAYGGNAGLWTALFLLVTYSTRWPTIPWAFLRYDYVAGLILATALVKKGRPWLAGAFAGWAAAVRLFPAMWLWGPLAQGLTARWTGRARRPILWFLLGFVVVVGGLQLAGSVRYGSEQTRIHLENMRDHNSEEQLSSRRIGLALALTHDGRTLPRLLTPERRDAIRAQRPLRYGLALAALLLMGWGLRRARPDEAFGFGFVPFFLLTTASYYYYVTRATLVVVHAGDLERLRNRLALAWLFGLEAFCNAAETVLPEHRMFLLGTLSWGLALYVVVLTGWLLWESAQAEGVRPRRMNV